MVATMTMTKPGVGETKARADLKLAQERLGRLVGDLAAASRAVTAADERRWDKQEEIERLERAERGARQDALAEEGDLVAAIMEDRPLPAAAARPNAAALEKLQAEADVLRGAAERLKSRLPERRDAVSTAELAVRSAVRSTVSSSSAVDELLSRTEFLLAEFIGLRAAIAAIVGCFDHGEVADRAARLLGAVPIHLDHAAADLWRTAIERLSRDPDAALPVVGGEV